MMSTLSVFKQLWPYLLLMVLAFSPRAYDLPRFVTADEAKWVYRSAQFLSAFLTGQYADTSVNLTPAVTTTWLGSIGLTTYYALNQATINQPFITWLQSLPPYRAELDILLFTRWPMVIMATTLLLLIYHLAKSRLTPPIALLGAIFIALSPHIISLERILGHDAPTALFMTIALLLLIGPLPPSPTTLILSGIATGLACLSKAPAFFLIPFVGLYLMMSSLPSETDSNLSYMRRLTKLNLLSLVRTMAIWGLAAYLTFIVVWPAAWVDPLGAPTRVIENAFLSATDTEEAAEEGYWLVPNLGPTYYLVNGGFKLSPLVMVGLIVSLWLLWRNRHQPTPPMRYVGWFLLFALLFTLFMTLGGKRSPRYILPIFAPCAFIAAWGWWQLLKPRSHGITISGLTLAAMLILWPYAPYYYSYYNPLLGGWLTAPHVMKIGWGEGLDQVGRYLQREQPHSRVGTAYASTIAPYFSGALRDETDADLDVVVQYIKQRQSGEPTPLFSDYFALQMPLFQVDMNGLPYARLYAGPTLHLLDASSEADPLAYRPLNHVGAIGETLAVEVLWSMSAGSAELTLHPSAEDTTTILARSAAPRQAIAPHVIATHHALELPSTLARGIYFLRVEGQPLGEIDLRYFTVPSTLSLPSEAVLFADRIALAGYSFSPQEDYIGLTLAWQAQQTPLPDYTIFTQLVDATSHERVAGFDSPPVDGTWPTSRWMQGEVVLDERYIAVPPNVSDGYYDLILGLYDPTTGERLTLPDGRDSWTIPWSFIREQR